MSLQAITDKITNDAATKAQRILHDGQEQLKEKKKAVESTIKDLQTQQQEEINRSLEENRHVFHSQLRLEEHLTLQRAKRRELDKALQTVEEKIKSALEKESPSLLKKELKNYSKDEQVTVYVPNGRKLDYKVNDTVTVKEDSGIEAGFVIETKDTLEHHTLESTMNEHKKQIEQTLSKSLFT